MRFHLREALRARLPFSALSLSLSRSKPSTYSSSPLGPILCCRVSWATKRSSTPNKEEILLQIPSLVFRKLTAASPTRLGSFVVDRLLFRAEWCRNRKKTHTHTHSPTSSVRPLLIVLYELVGKIPGRIGEEDWNHSIRHGGDVERGG